MTARRLGLFVLALITAAAAYWAPPAQPDENVEVVVRARPAADAGPRRPEADVSPAAEIPPLTPRQLLDATAAPAFQVPRWADVPKVPIVAMPSAPPAAPAAQPVPVAPAGPPPVTFSVLGSLEESGQPAVFVLHDGQNLVVRPGDAIGAHYRVERIEEAALVVLHLPTQQSQTVSLGSRR